MLAPATLATRPTFAGLPVPYFVGWVGERPDFRLLDAKRQGFCFAYAKCAICGSAAPAPRFLICGPIGLENRVHTEPAVHEACARYALLACPYLSRADSQRREGYPAGSRHAHGGLAEKPSELFLVELDKWQLLRVPSGRLLNFRPVRSLRYYYLAGRLVEDAAGWQRVALSTNWRQGGGTLA